MQSPKLINHSSQDDAARRPSPNNGRGAHRQANNSAEHRRGELRTAREALKHVQGRPDRAVRGAGRRRGRRHMRGGGGGPAGRCRRGSSSSSSGGEPSRQEPRGPAGRGRRGLQGRRVRPAAGLVLLQAGLLVRGSPRADCII